MKSPIVLLTDYGLQDPYAGILRGVLASLAPQIPVLDLCHEIQPQNVRQAGIFLEMSYRYFPRHSIFVCVVDPMVGTSRRIVLLQTAKHFFLAPDNGLLTRVLAAEKIVEARVAENKALWLSEDPSLTFHGRDIFAPVAARLAIAKNSKSYLKQVGSKISSLRTLTPDEPKITNRQVVGKVLYFDHFGNAVTNIQRIHIPSAEKRKISVSAGNYHLGTLSQTYGGGKKPVCFWNSFGYLEVAVPCGSAETILKVNTQVKVRL